MINMDVVATFFVVLLVAFGSLAGYLLDDCDLPAGVPWPTRTDWLWLVLLGAFVVWRLWA